MNSNNNKKLKVIFLNARSLRNKMTEIDAILHTHNFNIDILIVNETWIYENETKYFNIDGYNSTFNCRNENTGGGTAINIKNSIKHKLIQKETTYNSLVIELIETTPKIKIATAYRAPNQNTQDYIDFIDELTNKHKNLIYIADTNIDLLKINQESINYINTVVTNGYSIINYQNVTNEPTRIKSSTKTLIDHIISNLENKFKFKIDMEDVSGFDHKIIITTLQKIIIKKHKMINNKYNKINYENYYKTIEYNINNYNYTEINQFIQMIIDTKTINTTEHTIRTRNNKWITYEVLNMIKTRNKLYKKIKGDPENRTLKISIQ